MSSLLVYLLTTFDVQTFTVEAPGRRPAHEVLSRFLGSALSALPEEAENRTERPTLDGCTPCGSVARVPQLGDSWQDWCALSSAVIIRSTQVSTLDERLAGDRRSSSGGTVEFTTGPDSGFAFDLPPGDWTLGRSAASDLALADPFISRESLTMSNEPGGLTARSASGIALTVPVSGEAASTVVLGSTRLCIVPAQNAELPLTRSFEWPPPPEVEPPRPPSWIYYILPLVLGMVLVLITGMWWFLLFTLSGPLSAALNWWVEKRRFARETRESFRTYRTVLKGFLADVFRSVEESRDTSRAQPMASAAFTIGYGTALSPVSVRNYPLPGHPAGRPGHSRSQSTGLPNIDELLERHRINGTTIDRDIHPHVADCPILFNVQEVDLDITGPHDVVCDVVRAIVASALEVGLPVAFHDSPSPVLLPELMAAAVDQAEDSGDSSSMAAGLQIAIAHRDGRTRAELRSPGGTAAHTVRQRWRIDCRPESSTGQLTLLHADRPRGAPVPLSGMIELRRLRPERFLTLNSRWRTASATALPPRVLEDLLTSSPTGSRPWSGPGQAPSRVPIGSGTVGPVTVDLFRDGPHALVAGTTGSGKSVLLQTWVTALAASMPPADLRFVLVDFKGGAAFAPFAELAHVDTIVDNLDPAAALRALRSLRAEILHREALFADSGIADIDEFNASHALPLPRVVVIVDEFQALIQDNPSGVETIESLTALGRSLGLHLVLATQRPAGIITSRMKANINLRIALRVRDAPDSWEVIEHDAAAAIDPAAPGTGFISRGSQPEPFRVAPAQLTEATEDALPEIVEWTRLADSATGSSTLPRPPTDARRTGLTVPSLVRASRLSTDDDTSQRAARIVLPPLPTRVEKTSAAGLGLLDFPDENRTEQWAYDPARDGSVIITGGRGHGTSAAVRAFAAAALDQEHSIVCLSTSPPGFTHPNMISASHSDLWAVEYLLGALEEPRTARNPITVCIDDYDVLRNSLEGTRRLNRLERLLTGGFGNQRIQFVIAADRRVLHSGIAPHARTRIVFPPPDAHDTVHFGVSPRRFHGEWPPGRAVVLGPVTASAGPDGADVQLVHIPESDDGSTLHRVSSTGFRPGGVPDDDARHPGTASAAWLTRAGLEPSDSSIVLGTGPLGEDVSWNPLLHGPVLSIRSSESQARKMVRALRGAESAMAESALGITTIPEAHRADHDLLAPALSSDACILGYPLHHSPGYSSPLHKAPSLGPTLVIGARTDGELADIGLRDLPLVPGPPTRGWFVTAQRAIPVDVAAVLTAGTALTQSRTAQSRTAQS